MKLMSLKLKNFRQYRSLDTVFPSGLIGIYGANGIGKSNLINAIAWLLYGNDALGEAKEAIKYNGASSDEDVTGELVFGIGGSIYKIQRSFRGATMRPTAALYRGNDLQAQKIEAVAESIRNLLGMDWKTFYISIYCRQKEINALSGLQPAQRREEILRMLGIHKLDTIVAEVRKESRDVNSKIQVMSSKIGNYDATAVNKSIADYQNADIQWKDYIAKKQEEFNAKQGNLSASYGATPRETEIAAEIASLNGKIQELDSTYHAVCSAISVKNNRLIELTNKAVSITQLGPDGECPYCTNSLGEKYPTVLADLNAQADAARTEVNGSIAQRDEITLDKDNIYNQIAVLNQEAATLKTEREEQFFQVQREISTLQREISDANTKYREVSIALTNFTNMKKEYEQNKDVYQELSNKREELVQLEDGMVKFRAYMISQVCPALSAHASELLEILSMGKYSQIVIDPDYSIRVLSDGTEHPTQHFSGGEVDLFNICLRMAISRMIIDQSGHDINILFLDEILSALDTSRTTSVMNMLGEYADKLGQIFIITHQPDISDMLTCRFDVVEANDGSSYVRAVVRRE